MKIFLLTLALTALTGGYAMANNYQQTHSCENVNTKACRDARAAYAEHHNGQSPEQFNNHWYQGKPGRWSQSDKNKNWRWDGANGEQYSKSEKGWKWSDLTHKHHNDNDHDHN